MYSSEDEESVSSFLSSPPRERFDDDEDVIALAATTTARGRDDRPALLRPMDPLGPGRPYFDTRATSPGIIPLVDPVASGSMVDGISPHGAVIETLEYNVRHGIERRDEARVAICVTELFRHFVLLNRPMRRVHRRGLDRQATLDMAIAVGPFANPASLGMHQRLLTMLLGVCVRQVGCATPCALSFVKDQWLVYERHLFSQPFKALAVLLGIGAALCHARKDASVAYARHVFEDASRAREWRADVLTHGHVLDTFLGSADDATQARRMLLCNKVYFNTRLRLRRYQAVCIGTPHPEYMCQGGAMHRANVRSLVAGMQAGAIAASPSATRLVQDMEQAMIHLDAQVNNLHDRDAFDSLQVDLQILLYLLHRVLNGSVQEGPDALMAASAAIVLGSPHHIRESYAFRLWHQAPDRMDLIHYGILGEPLLGKFAARRKGMGRIIDDFVETPSPSIVPKVHALLPPSVYRDENHVLRELPQTEAQRHPGLRSLRFLQGLFRLRHMWTKCRSVTSLKDAQERVVVDRDFIDIQQPYRVLYRCGKSSVCAAEVRLQGHAAAELMMTTTTPVEAAGASPKIETSDAAEAEILADHLVEGHQTMLAVVVGPWSCHEVPRLEQEMRRFQELKQRVGVHPDRAFVKRMLLLDFKTLAQSTAHVLGRTYAWAVYVPGLHQGDRVVLSIDDLKKLVGKDPALDRVARAVLTPKAMVRPLVVMKRTCGEFCAWRVDDNYVSFAVACEDTTVVLRDVRFHAIAETLLGQCPDHRHADTGTRTTEIIQAIFHRCRTDPKYADVTQELARCETLLLG
jgi:hypothetical protein